MAKVKPKAPRRGDDPEENCKSKWIGRPGLPQAMVYRDSKKAVASIGRPDARFHALRHVFAANAPEHGMDVKTLSNIIGVY